MHGISLRDFAAPSGNPNHFMRTYLLIVKKRGPCTFPIMFPFLDYVEKLDWEWRYSDEELLS